MSKIKLIATVLFVEILIAAMMFTPVLADDSPPPYDPNNVPSGALTELAPSMPDHPEGYSAPPPGASTEIAPSMPDRPEKESRPEKWDNEPSAILSMPVVGSPLRYFNYR